MDQKFVKVPPPSGRGRYPRAPHPGHQQIADMLKSRPGEYMIVNQGGTKSALSGLRTAIVRGKYLAYRPAGSFEAYMRGDEVWAAFVGEG